LIESGPKAALCRQEPEIQTGLFVVCTDHDPGFVNVANSLGFNPILLVGSIGSKNLPPIGRICGFSSGANPTVISHSHRDCHAAIQPRPRRPLPKQ